MTQSKKTKTKTGARTAGRKSSGKRPRIEAVPLDVPDLNPKTTLKTGPETTLQTGPETTLQTGPETTLQTGKVQADAGGEDGAAAESVDESRADDGAQERIAELETQLAEKNDLFLRARAETENVRRRGEKEREDALNYGAANFARDILSVADNLRRALDALPAKAREEGDEALSGLATGVELTEKELQAALERHGVAVIDAEGQKFDHNLHQAMMEVPGSEHPPGTVVQVLQVGYTIKDRLLRPAMVGVAKGDANGKPGKGSKLDTSA